MFLGVAAAIACDPDYAYSDMTVSRLQGSWENLEGGSWLEIWWDDDNTNSYVFEAYEWSESDSTYIMTDEGSMTQTDSLSLSRIVISSLSVKDCFSVTLLEPDRMLAERTGSAVKGYSAEFKRIKRLPFEKKPWYDIFSGKNSGGEGTVSEGGDDAE